MCMNAVSSIKEYLSNETVNWNEFRMKRLDHLLDRCFKKHESIPTPPRSILQLTWKKLIPIYRKGMPSHTRSVYVSSPDLANQRWVIKIETACLRTIKRRKSFPTVEEAAYEVCKKFRWKTIPKTIVLHEAEKDRQKNGQYLHLMEPFKDKTGKYPITCTFQPFVEGNVLPSKEELESGAKKMPLVQLSSYQEACLLGMILGYGDDRGDNTVRSLKGRLYQIDQEYIGWGNCDSVLDNFKVEKNLPIMAEVMNGLFKVTREELLAIQKKSTQKDAEIAKHWEEEPTNFLFPERENSSGETWAIIRLNLSLIQKTAEFILKNKKSVSLVELQKGFKKLKRTALEGVRREVNKTLSLD